MFLVSEFLRKSCNSFLSEILIYFGLQILEINGYNHFNSITLNFFVLNTFHVIVYII